LVAEHKEFESQLDELKKGFIFPMKNQEKKRIQKLKLAGGPD
jgi:hypothetical protein